MASVERVGPLTPIRRGEAQPILVESIEDGHPTRFEDEADVDVSLSWIPARPLEQFDPFEGLARQSVQSRKRIGMPPQVKVGPSNRATGVDRVPRDREIVKLLVIDLDLLAVEVEQDRAVREPLVALKVPDHPDSRQSPASKTTQAMCVLLHNVTAVVQPHRLVADDAEIERCVILSELSHASSIQVQAAADQPLLTGRDVR
ncbi:hypothetical protein AB0L75_42490 [Streptomyces sp. NPDC052101]|uniref:hypothetical protein n=1 Tax=Streptomyces sp. NPDC052101 TaxID=3155763 RepID=UPI0034184155